MLVFFVVCGGGARSAFLSFCFVDVAFFVPQICSAQDISFCVAMIVNKIAPILTRPNFIGKNNKNTYYLNSLTCLIILCIRKKYIGFYNLF